MPSQLTDEVKPSSRAPSWIAAAVAGAMAIAGAGFALAAFALPTQHLVLSSRTLVAIFGLLLLFVGTVMALVRRLAQTNAEPETPESAKPDEADEAVGLTRRVRLLRGNDDL
jgi:uncharacterized membrane protein YfcA